MQGWVVAFDKVSSWGAQPGWHLEESQGSRGEWDRTHRQTDNVQLSHEKGVYSLDFLVVRDTSKHVCSLQWEWYIYLWFTYCIQFESFGLLYDDHGIHEDRFCFRIKTTSII